jgi:hypothetical protein
MTSYASEYPPSVAFDTDYKKFFEEFYATSDDPSAHDKYVSFFTEDATLIMASKTGKGSSGTFTPFTSVRLSTQTFNFSHRNPRNEKSIVGESS